nr:isocitrate dehydrogenase [NAD] catalytic subunit 5, mitochondrial [Arachis hypogaea]
MKGEEHYVGTEIDHRTQFYDMGKFEISSAKSIGMKGPMATPIAKGHRSLNLTLRKELIESTVGLNIRLRGVVGSLKIITCQASLRVAEYAFHYAKEHGRERVSAIHKAIIIQKTDGLFLKLVRNPAPFDVLVMPNLYGDVISDLCWLGWGFGCTSGEGGIALAKAVHGSAPDIAEKNLANPTGLLLSGVSMLRHLNLHDKADQIQNVILSTIAEGKYRTADLGGKAKKLSS